MTWTIHITQESSSQIETGCWHHQTPEQQIQQIIHFTNIFQIIPRIWPIINHIWNCAALDIMKENNRFVRGWWWWIWLMFCLKYSQFRTISLFWINRNSQSRTLCLSPENILPPLMRTFQNIKPEDNMADYSWARYLPKPDFSLYLHFKTTVDKANF